MNCYKCNKELKEDDPNVYELPNGEPCCQSCYNSFPEPEEPDEPEEDDTDRHEEYEEQQAYEDQRDAMIQEDNNNSWAWTD